MDKLEGNQSKQIPNVNGVPCEPLYKNQKSSDRGIYSIEEQASMPSENAYRIRTLVTDVKRMMTQRIHSAPERNASWLSELSERLKIWKSDWQPDI